jgi:predicted esterase
MKIILALLITISFRVFSQDLSVPDSIKNELQIREYVVASDTFSFQIVYPKNYDSTKTYPVYLALSGGNQSLEIVNYCYAAWFKSDNFDNYYTVLPIANKGGNLRDYTAEKIKNLYISVQNNLNVSSNNWILGGTSNGGVATFNFLSVNPKLFAGAIVMPGVMTEKIVVTDDWKHLKILLAFGTKDSKHWQKGVKTTQKRLKNKVKSIQTFKMKGQGHILPLSYNIDLVYHTYFN